MLEINGYSFLEDGRLALLVDVGGKNKARLMNAHINDSAKERYREARRDVEVDRSELDRASNQLAETRAEIGRVENEAKKTQELFFQSLRASSPDLAEIEADLSALEGRKVALTRRLEFLENYVDELSDDYRKRSDQIAEKARLAYRDGIKTDLAQVSEEVASVLTDERLVEMLTRIQEYNRAH